MQRNIIDMHSHLFPDDSVIGQLRQTAELYGIEKIVLHGLEWPGSSQSKNDSIQTVLENDPGLFVGFGGVNLWEPVDPNMIDSLKYRGFTGIKFILPPEPYHSETFYPYYERAEQLGMPVLFHLGIVSANDTRGIRVDNNYMRPIYLDTIARDFRDLTIIGAHLGNPWYEEATMSARWNPNLFFDLTGSTLKKKSPEFIGELLWWNETTEYGSSVWSNAWEQIVFGTDVIPARVKGVMDDYDALLSALEIQGSLAEKVYYGTARWILEKAGVKFE